MDLIERTRIILPAAEQWKTRCLLDGRSIFSDEALWAKQHFASLDRYFVQNLDWGEGDFFQKLKSQLEAASPESKKLAAELLWVMYLIISASAMSAETKRNQIKMVWGWSGDAISDVHWALGDVLGAGVSNPGPAYQAHRWREYRFFITAMVDWTALGKEDRRRLLDDPWVFADWLEEREFAKGRQLRHVLLYLLFPDTFDRILTTSQKIEIVKAYSKKWGGGYELGDGTRIEIDRAVQAVRDRLGQQYPDRLIDFYESPFVEEWKTQPREPGPVKTGGPGQTTPSDVGDEAAFSARFGDVNAWVISAGEGGRLWNDFKANKVAAIGWDDLGDLSDYGSREAIHGDLVAASGVDNPFNNSLALWQFCHEIAEGDVLVVKQGRARLLGYGVVSGEYRHDSDRVEYKNVIPVEWVDREPCAVQGGHGIAVKALTGGPGWDVTVMPLIRMLDGDRNGIESSGEDDYPPERALEGLFLAPEDFTRILDAIGRRKNLILQGPPGVGKTFIAKRIAWSLIRAKRPEQVEMVQFHQSYAYEDFVQGWRPTEAGGFSLRNGVFYEFCKRAAEAPEKEFVFIIDEINRGNLSRIFGELLMLIEADKRGEDYAVPLTYSQGGERFNVPENVIILGLMNTADRSLAMVDYALRRRFAFVALESAFGSQSFRDYLVDAGADPALVARIDDRMSALNEKIRADTKNLGPGFEVGHSYFVPSEEDESLDDKWFKDVVHTQVEPLLSEYWFDQPEVVASLVSDLLS